MRKILFTIIYLTLIALVSCHDGLVSKKNEVLDIVIHVTTTSSYCGGARPPEEMLLELNTPRKFPERNIIIRKGNVNRIEDEVVWSGKSDANGVLNIALAPGEYCLSGIEKASRSYVDSLLRQHQSATPDYEAADATCLEQWASQPELVFTVSPNQLAEFSVNFHQPCFWNALPCVHYIGPKPG